MARSIVTSENKAEYDEGYLSRRMRQYEKDAEAAEKASSGVKEDSISHERAMRAHKHASIYAHPPENIEKHLERAKFHEKEARKYQNAEKRRIVKAAEERRNKEGLSLLRKKGVVASTDYEKN